MKRQTAEDRFFWDGSDLFGQNNIDYKKTGMLVPERSIPSDRILILLSMICQEMV